MIWLIGNKGMLGSDFEKGIKDSGLQYVASDREVDITDLGVLRDFTKDKSVEWIINCSAYTAVDKAEDEKEIAFKINADGVLNITKIAKELNAKLIHISTDYVFDGESESALFEDDATGPIGVYGDSKLAGEQNIVNNYDKFFIVRTAWLYGKNGNNFPYTMIRLFKEREVVKVVSDQFGTPTYTKDLAELILAIVKKDSASYGIYHFTNEGRTNWHLFAKKIYELSCEAGIVDGDKKLEIVPIKTEEYPTKAKRPKNSYLSKEKVKKTFGITISQWEDSLKKFIAEIK
ncbi:MAG TPA: dTDP-4-dehydrorhamnose reductase [Spirochaetota bacterium]|nr:dTDP-4-dehydrorhamnose reductase [Spirochaetota bacterium]